MEYQYRENCPCDRKGTSTIPCPGRICRYHINMRWFLEANLDVEEADFLLSSVVDAHKDRMATASKIRPNYRSRWE